MERGGGAQAYRHPVRGDGLRRSAHGGGAAQAVVDPVLLMRRRYLTLSDLPPTLPVFPLTGVLLLPHSALPLNVFEPRYLQMVDEVPSASRVIGMVQPEGSSQEESPVGRTVCRPAQYRLRRPRHRLPGAGRWAPAPYADGDCPFRATRRGWRSRSLIAFARRRLRRVPRRSWYARRRRGGRRP